MIPSTFGARASLGFLLVSLVLAGTATVRAVHIEPVQPVAGQNESTDAVALLSPPPPSIDVQAVGANDVFQPDRSALPSRYRMPGESAPDATPAAEAPRPAVLGTVLSTDGSNFATCQLPGGRPTLVRVGDRLGDYTVTSIGRDVVTFKTAGGATIEVTTKRPGN
jgi:type IV pilus biogenesis protein PilP